MFEVEQFKRRQMDEAQDTQDTQQKQYELGPGVLFVATVQESLYF